MAIGDRETSDTVITFEKNVVSAALKDITAGDDLIAGDDVTAGDDLISTDDVTVGDDLVVTGDASIGATFAVTGTSAFTGNVTMAGRLNIFGATGSAQAAHLAAVNTGTLNTGDATSDTVIGDIRTKLNSVVTALQNFGLLAAS